MAVVMRLISLILIVAALLLLGADAISSLERGGELTVRSLNTVWGLLDPASLDGFKGWVQTWLVHMRSPAALWRDLGPASFLACQILFAGMVMSAIAHPIFLLTMAYDVVHIAEGSVLNTWQSVLFAIDCANVFLGYLTFIVLGWQTLGRKEKKSLWLTVVLTPFYAGRGTTFVIDGSLLLAFFYLVVIGTALTFSLYLKGAQMIGGPKASILSCAEPLRSALLSVILLGMASTLPDWLGTLLIVSSVVLISMDSRRRVQTSA